MQRRLMAAACGLMLVSLAMVEAGGNVKREDIPKYLNMLKSTNAKDRATAAQMIGKRGLINATDVDSAVEPLKKAMVNDKDSAVRKQAVLAIGNIQPEGKDTVPVLIEMLQKEKTMDVKVATAIALGQYGAEAKPAVPSLRQLLAKINNKKSNDARTVQAALQAINGKKK